MGPNPDDRDPSAFGIQLQAGARLGFDSGSIRQSSVSSSFLVDVSYGNAFSKSFAHPFDVFRVRIQVSDVGGINVVNARGRLYARELTDTTAARAPRSRSRNASSTATVRRTVCGGPSIGVGFVSGYAMGHGYDLQAEVYGEALVLAGIDAPRTRFRGPA